VRSLCLIKIGLFVGLRMLVAGGRLGLRVVLLGVGGRGLRVSRCIR